VTLIRITIMLETKIKNGGLTGPLLLLPIYWVSCKCHPSLIGIGLNLYVYSSKTEQYTVQL